MRFIVLGTSEFTLCCARGILQNGEEISAIVSKPSHALPNNSANISNFAQNNRIPYHEIEDINAPKSLELLRNYKPIFIFSSWPNILRKNVLDIPQRFVIGTHPTDLPFNRGRHPLHWIIVLGIRQTKLSFFRMDEGIDSGKILLQVPIEIGSEDSIFDVIMKVNDAGFEGTRLLCKRISQTPSWDGTEQDHSYANYWRKRTPHDVTIDLRMSAEVIIRTVKSFTQPYLCANLIFKKYVIKINNASFKTGEFDSVPLQRIEPGRIISIKNHIIRVKVADDIVDLECQGELPWELLEAKYIHPPSKYLSEWYDEINNQLI